jgi:hypothetical protein
VCAEGKHRKRDERLVAVEPERDAGQKSDLGVGRLDESLREAGVERGVDRLAVHDDATLDVHERGDPRAARPSVLSRKTQATA